ncbi:MAG TPA: hypothetical protein VIC07_08195 [Acidimicrobiia bacterium]|jgi:hypothetical protein
MSQKRPQRRAVKDEDVSRVPFAPNRHRLRSPEIDAEPSRSPLDALAKGLVSIGERLRSRPTLRVL